MSAALRALAQLLVAFDLSAGSAAQLERDGAWRPHALERAYCPRIAVTTVTRLDRPEGRVLASEVGVRFRCASGAPTLHTHTGERCTVNGWYCARDAALPCVPSAADMIAGRLDSVPLVLVACRGGRVVGVRP